MNLRRRLVLWEGREVRVRVYPVTIDREELASAAQELEVREAREDILRWLGGFSRPPAMTYLVHGEPVALEALRARIQQERQWPVHVAAQAWPEVRDARDLHDALLCLGRIPQGEALPEDVDPSIRSVFTDSAWSIVSVTDGPSLRTGRTW